MLHSDMSSLILVGQMWKQESSLEKSGKATWQLTSKQEEGSKVSEPTPQMMEFVRRRHMIQKAHMAAVHKLEWETTIWISHQR